MGLAWVLNSPFHLVQGEQKMHFHEQTQLELVPKWEEAKQGLGQASTPLRWAWPALVLIPRMSRTWTKRVTSALLVLFRLLSVCSRLYWLLEQSSLFQSNYSRGRPRMPPPPPLHEPPPNPSGLRPSRGPLLSFPPAWNCWVCSCLTLFLALRVTLVSPQAAAICSTSKGFNHLHASFSFFSSALKKKATWRWAPICLIFCFHKG